MNIPIRRLLDHSESPAGSIQDHFSRETHPLATIFQSLHSESIQLKFDSTPLLHPLFITCYGLGLKQRVCVHLAKTSGPSPNKSASSLKRPSGSLCNDLPSMAQEGSGWTASGVLFLKLLQVRSNQPDVAEGALPDEEQCAESGPEAVAGQVTLPQLDEQPRLEPHLLFGRTDDKLEFIKGIRGCLPGQKNRPAWRRTYSEHDPRDTAARKFEEDTCGLYSRAEVRKMLEGAEELWLQDCKCRLFWLHDTEGWIPDDAHDSEVMAARSQRWVSRIEGCSNGSCLFQHLLFALFIACCRYWEGKPLTRSLDSLHWVSSTELLQLVLQCGFDDAVPAAVHTLDGLELQLSKMVGKCLLGDDGDCLREWLTQLVIGKPDDPADSSRGGDRNDD